MAYDDPITEKQMNMIRGLAREQLADYEHLDDLDPYTLPVYGCRVREMSRGQGSMLIDSLRWEKGERDDIERPTWETIFGEEHGE